jgi:hypothetical protein
VAEIRDSIFSRAHQNVFMKLPVLLGIGIATLAALASCAAFKSEKPVNPSEKTVFEAPKLIGRVASTPADKRFVLIQSYERWNLEAGTILTTRGPDERTANLRATGEILGQFAAADIQSGLVEVGDAVYSRHVPKPPETPVSSEPITELPENQQNPVSENVQKNN